MATLVIRELFSDGQEPSVAVLDAEGWTLFEFQAEMFGVRGARTIAPIRNEILAYYPWADYDVRAQWEKESPDGSMEEHPKWKLRED